MNNTIKADVRFLKMQLNLQINDLGVTVDYGPDSFCLKFKDAENKTYETSDVK